ncbi:hypothetical protein B0H16DRAFT_615577 [Mycena metata]|uniref:Uncharacterized protein n=1 Tax=Mycena metata TaxID=1033252 RepID=A0AAD7KBS8_9AGAR|nr:hypothetical protein B0H16DRAFT_615577 [Mycena metata]
MMTVSTAAGLLVRMEHLATLPLGRKQLTDYYSSSYDGRSVMVSSTACMPRDINNIPAAIGRLLLAVVATTAPIIAMASVIPMAVASVAVAVAAARVDDGLRIRVLRRIVVHGCRRKRWREKCRDQLLFDPCRMRHCPCDGRCSSADPEYPH